MLLKGFRTSVAIQTFTSKEEELEAWVQLAKKGKIKTTAVPGPNNDFSKRHEDLWAYEGESPLRMF